MRRPHQSRMQMSLPGVRAGTPRQSVTSAREGKIQHKQILRALQEASCGGRSLVEIYRRDVIPNKTRTIQLLGRKSTARIVNTLLGFELQAQFKRIPCPDMATARYLKLFTELGCHSIKLPYDPTVTDRIIPELELAMNRLAAGVQALFPGEHTLQLYVLRRVYSHLRSQLHSE